MRPAGGRAADGRSRRRNCGRRLVPLCLIPNDFVFRPTPDNGAQTLTMPYMTEFAGL